MKFLLTNKKGVTILEGLIALLLLAMVSVGTFGVLLSTSRKAAKPDIEEEMLLTVEKTRDLLQIYSFYMLDDSTLQSDTHAAVIEAVRQALCVEDTSTNPLSTGEHTVTCMLPTICDANNSSFSYTVSDSTVSASAFWSKYGDNGHENSTDFGSGSVPSRQILFNISCNGYTL